jgi:hypothetical protein
MMRAVSPLTPGRGEQYWVLLSLLPVTCFVQQMVVWLGIPTGKGHAAMICLRFGPGRSVVAVRSAHRQLADPGDRI